MAKHNIGSLVVLKPGDQHYIAGIVTERGIKLTNSILSQKCSCDKHNIS